MSRQLSCFWIGLLLSPPLLAQKPADYARTVDQSLAEEDPEWGRYWCTEVIVNKHHRPWPAVGRYQVHYRFYFDRDEGGPDRDPQPYPDRLVKVVGRREFSARWEERQVWFQNGQAVFFQRSTPEGSSQLDLTDISRRNIQEAQREAGEMLRIFRQLQQLP